MASSETTLPAGKQNLFDGYLHCQPGHENRLTWALMNLIRISPMVRAAFLDLIREHQVRERQQEPIPALATLRERECIVQTQVGSLVATEGRLLAIGITAEGGEVDAEIQAKDREAIYDGVVTFMAPEGRQHEQESLSITVESKLGSVVGSWQLMPSESSLGEERQIKVDRQAVVLAWRDIVGLLSDLGLRGLLTPAERVLVQDFVDYIAANHAALNPFNHFAVCRDHTRLLNRRCEAIMREIDPVEAWHGSTPIIGVEFSAYKQIWLRAEEGGGSWQIVLRLHPGDNMSQARSFWPRVATKGLRELQDRDWLLEPNMHFSFISTHLHWAETSLEVNDYIALWKPGENEIVSLYRDDSGDYRHNWDRLIDKGLITPADAAPLQEVTTDTRRCRISMSPGLSLSYSWSADRARQLDRDGAFTQEVKKRIREATETWDEVPAFCRQ